MHKMVIIMVVVLCLHCESLCIYVSVTTLVAKGFISKVKLRLCCVKVMVSLILLAQQYLVTVKFFFNDTGFLSCLK